MKIFSSLLLILLLITACKTPQKAYWDSEVDRLCAIDGGVRVYETVPLPPDKFNKWGQINFYRPTQDENTLGSEYIYKSDMRYYKKGDPGAQGVHMVAMKRDHIQIIRKSDMKLLGEVVMYYRAGGDLPGPWHHSSYQCPDRSIATEGALLEKVFKKSLEGNKK